MPIYELINPSDPYTFEAESIEVAGAAVVYLSTSFGAREVGCEDDEGESTPTLFGWEEWLKDRGIDSDWIAAHRTEIADALDSFLIGDPATRQDVEDMLAELPPDKREAWKAKRQDRHRTSMSKIGEAATDLAQRLRARTD